MVTWCGKQSYWNHARSFLPLYVMFTDRLTWDMKEMIHRHLIHPYQDWYFNFKQHPFFTATFWYETSNKPVNSMSMVLHWKYSAFAYTYVFAQRSLIPMFWVDTKMWKCPQNAEVFLFYMIHIFSESANSKQCNGFWKKKHQLVNCKSYNRGEIFISLSRSNFIDSPKKSSQMKRTLIKSWVMLWNVFEHQGKETELNLMKHLAGLLQDEQEAVDPDYFQCQCNFCQSNYFRILCFIIMFISHSSEFIAFCRIINFGASFNLGDSA